MLLLLTALLCALMPALVVPALTSAQAAVPSTVPATTPNINDGEVNAIAEVGTTMIAGGTFTSVSSAGSSATISRTYLVAFNENTGVVSTTFNPVLDGTVEDVMAGPTSGTVYVAGSFKTINGATARRVALLNVSTGALVTSFSGPAFNGKVNALWQQGTHLIVGGNFDTVGGETHSGLVSLNATTGALETWINSQLTGHHNYTGTSGSNGAVGVKDVVANSSQIVAIGNFKTVDGYTRDQMVVYDTTSSTVSVNPNWNTNGYTAACYNFAFDSYMRGLDISPDGTWVAVTTTGGYNAGSLCDSVSRFELGATGQAITPTWTDYTGGDTTWANEITDDVTYVGGHLRWLNNPSAADKAGQGAVARPGLAAVDNETGLPVAWNPGRNPRGVAIYDFLDTSTGLWLGYDTEYIGNYEYVRKRIAEFPLAGGSSLADSSDNDLTSQVLLGGSTAVDQGNVLYRVNAGGSAVPSIDGGPAWEADGTYRSGSAYSASYSPSATLGSTVASSTPAAVFDTEEYSTSDSPKLTYTFPVTAGVPVQVRLYFANRYSGTSAVGQRVFDVQVEGSTVLSKFDIVAAAGADQTAVEKTFNVTSDGSITVSFSHQTENPLVNAIELVRTDKAAPVAAASTLKSVAFDGTTAGTPTSVDTQGIDWSTVRGAFIAGGKLWYGSSTGTMYSAAITSTGLGTPTVVDPYHSTKWDDVQNGSGSTYEGMTVGFYGQLSSVTGMTYAHHRIYYTLSGSNNLYWRWFTPDSGIVGAVENTMTVSGVSFSSTQGLMAAGDVLYVVNSSTGALSKLNFSTSTPSGTLAAVNSSVDWRAHALVPSPWAASTTNADPTAASTASCTDLTCSFSGSGSSDSDGSIASYAWSFGDGSTGTGVSASHTYSAAGTYTVTLTVTDDDGATDTATRTVTVTAPTGGGGGSSSDVAYVASASTTANNANPSITVPSAVSAGDQLVLVGSYGASVTPSTPSGWTLVSSQTNGSLVSSVWTKTATASDAGASVTTALGSQTKSGLSVTAYSGVDTSDPVTDVASSTDTSTTSHTTPSVSVTDGGLLVQAWTDKSSATTDWTAPSGVTTREEFYGSNSGRITGLVADSSVTSTGTSSGATATTDASSRGISWALSLTPASGGSTGGGGSTASDIGFVGSVSAAYNRANPSVTVPSAVSAGDQLVLVGSYGVSGTVPTTPSGWTVVSSETNGSLESYVWTKTATAADAGSDVTTALGSQIKSALVLSAYSGVDTSDPVVDADSATDTSTTSHTTPSVSQVSGGWLVQTWTDKSSATTDWTAPSGVTTREEVYGSNSGRITALLADSGPASSAGTTSGATATSDASSRGISWAVSLRPAS
ncbi:PKD domain-containing protein [Nocardioides sp. GY 10127]|uniref:PKD domain-containing protein n=1 Tax=Nocardioides sp. GY 10127 TaxID=2569762 RepID=UPI0010A9200B|nr:PKD domain-containing protein [Nocardioides sp. GY 10127]TIC81854.1 PKD domain-containing protein [Nocardioides sp. GY 10127]